MAHLWTIIAVDDVASSVAWYQTLLGLPQSPPVHDYFGQVREADGTVLLCLHAWGEHEHPTLPSAEQGTSGHGLLLFFRVEDFEQALARARTLVDTLAEPPHLNPNTRTREFSLRDPDGYYVSISARSDT